MSDDAEVRHELELALGDEVTEFDRRPSEYRTSFALDEVDVTLSDGRRLELMFKDLGRPDPAARAAKPAFLADPLREIGIYRDVLEPAGLGTPRFYGASPERGWLFIERVRGVELFQVGARSTWEAVARWLAAMHQRLAAATGSAPRAIRYDRAYLERWHARALDFARARGDEPAAAALGALRRVHADGVELLLRLPRTVIHGELYASNVLVDAAVDPRRVAPVDWEHAGVGPGLVDLAALTSGAWDEGDRTAIARAYGEAAGADIDAAALDACRLHVSLQWLGWSPTWTPPPEHRQDWLAEADRAARALGL